MSEEIKNLPVDWASQMAAAANAEAKKEQPEIGTFSFRGGVLSFAGSEIPGNNIDIVVLATAHEHRYFPEEFDPDNIQSPLCWAFSEDGHDMAPDSALVTQAQVDGKCIDCPQFQWGSDPKGRGGRACKVVRRFICIPASEITNVAGAALGMGSIPTMSIKNWSALVNKVAAAMQRPSWAVICNMKCAPDAKTMIKVSFDDPRPVPEQYLGDILEKRDRAIEVLLKPYEKRPEGWDAPAEPKKRRKF